MSIELIMEEIKKMSADKVSQDTFSEKLKELTAAIEKRNADLETEIKTNVGSIDKTIEELKKDTQIQLANAVKEMGSAFVINRGEKGIEFPDAKTYGENFGEFLFKVRANSPELKALSENTGANGGYLVPPAWSNEILKLSLESAIVRGLGARQINLPSTSFDVPTLHSTSNSGSYRGGVQVYWGAEDTNIESLATQPKFGKVNLNVNKLIGYTEAYEDLTRDSFTAIGPLLQGIFGESIAFEEDYGFLNYDGVGKPLGILKAPCRCTVSRSTASQVHTTDVVTMLSRFCGKLDNAVWLANQTVLPYIYTLRDAAGNYIWMPGASGNISGRSPGTLYGIPLIITEKVPALGTEGDLILADFSQYLIGDLQGLRVEESTHFKFGTDKRVWKFVKRLDAKPWLNSAITPKLGGSTLSYFVTLV